MRRNLVSFRRVLLDLPGGRVYRDMAELLNPFPSRFISNITQFSPISLCFLVTFLLFVYCLSSQKSTPKL